MIYLFGWELPGAYDNAPRKIGYKVSLKILNNCNSRRNKAYGDATFTFV